MREEVRAMKNIKVYYSEAIANLMLQELSILVYGMQKHSNEYGGYTIGQYYFLLVRYLFCNQFMETFFKLFKTKKMLIKL